MYFLILEQQQPLIVVAVFCILESIIPLRAEMAGKVVDCNLKVCTRGAEDGGSDLANHCLENEIALGFFGAHHFCATAEKSAIILRKILTIDF